MFFVMSKVLWALAEPGNLLLVLLAFGAALLWTRWRRFGRRLVGLVAVVGLLLAVVPVGALLFGVLEDRFPQPTIMPEHVDGIVVLGGVADPVTTRARGRLALGSAVERITEAAALAGRYPAARVVYSAGSGSLLHQGLKEARLVAPLFERLGVAPGRLLLEDRSRNTFENAELSLALAQPKPGETWILVTSAFHMARAVGVFRRVGWPVIPFPVDYVTHGPGLPPPLQFNFTGGVNSLGGALHEFLGLLIYWLDGKTDALFPAPGDRVRA